MAGRVVAVELFGGFPSANAEKKPNRAINRIVISLFIIFLFTTL
jgi:hypothetical protein